MFAKLAARGVPDEPGVAYRIFAALADANIDVDMIVQSASVQKDKNDICLQLPKPIWQRLSAFWKTLKPPCLLIK